MDWKGVTGDQRPRISHLPISIANHGAAAIALCEMAGHNLDPWQQWLMDVALAVKDEMYWNDILLQHMNKSAAYEMGVVVARQNGKGGWLEGLDLAWLFLLGQRTILHTAHEMGTVKEHFERVSTLILECPELAAELAPGGIRVSNGDERIKLLKRGEAKHNQRMIFKTRTPKAGRGFSFDRVTYDEAMILDEKATKAISFTTSARPDPQLIYTGSAGNAESEQFGRVRSRGVKGNDPRLAFAEWSADLCSLMCEKGPRGEFICQVHDNRADPRTWFKANPGLGIRLQYENVNSEFLGMSEDAFDEERLSVGKWPTEGEAWPVITEEGWNNCLDETSQAQMPFTFGIDVSPDKKWSAIAVAGSNGDGNIHTEVTGSENLTDYRRGTDWVVSRAVAINRQWRGSVWVIDKATQAGAFYDELVKAGLKIEVPTAREYAQACGSYFASVMPIGGSVPDLRHLGQPELRNSVAHADKRDLAELWAWDKRNASDDISPLVASTLAVWGHRKRVNKPRPKPKVAWV